MTYGAIRVKFGLSENNATANSAENTAGPPAAAQPENSNVANDMVTLRERLPDYGSQHATRDTANSEFRFSESHRGGGIFAMPTSAIDVAAYLVAVGLAGSAAYFSITGMVVLFPAAGFAIVVMAAVMESAKLIVAGWLASRWRETFWLWRLLLIGFVLGLMSINAVGLYSQLVAAHVGRHGENRGGSREQRRRRRGPDRGGGR
jgi:hypothetical protein